MRNIKRITFSLGGGRIDFIDIAKAIGMLTIIWGHIYYGLSTTFVYVFHIPLFFFCSGLVFNPSRYASFGVFVKRRIKSLLIPYAVFSVLTWIIWAVFSYISHSSVENYWSPLLQTVIAQGSGGFLVHNVPLWFVTCLFCIEVFYFFIARMQIILRMFISFSLAFISYLLITRCTAFDFTLMPWNIEVAMLGLPIYMFGHICAERLDIKLIASKVQSHKLLSLIIISICAVIVYFGALYNGHISFGHSDLGKNGLCAYFFSIFGIIMILLMSMLLSACKSRFINNLKWFGQNSFYAMAIHNPIKGFVCVALGIILQCGVRGVGTSAFYSSIAFVLSLVVTIIGMYLINICANRMKSAGK